MMLSAGNNHVVVKRLRLKCSGLDALSARLRAAHLLNAASLHPSGLGPSAIIFIRKLRDPLPGRFPLQRLGLRPPDEWQRSLATAIDRAVKNAARPLLGQVCESAEAVLFLDRSELLACLMSDWCAGVAIHHWWWQSLFREADLEAAIRREWLAQPEYIPAAVARLAETGKAEQVCNALSERDARNALERVVRSFALHHLASVLDAVLDPGRQSMASQTRAGAGKLDAPQGNQLFAQGRPVKVAPWRPWVTEDGTALGGLEAAMLIGVCLLIERAPGVVRTANFARAVLEWHQSASAFLNRLSSHSGKPDHFAGRNAQHPSAMNGVEPSLAQTSLPQTGQSDSHSAPSGSQTSGAGLESGAYEETLMAPDGVKHLMTSRDSQSDGESVPATLRPLLPEDSPSASSEGDAATVDWVEALILPAEDRPSGEQAVETSPLIEAQVETAMGGVFYLINLGLFLELYGDFTSPARPGIALPIWDFLALLGCELSAGELARDPVYSLLARLACRSEMEEPGAHFEPPSAWRIPPAWLLAFPDESIWQWDDCDGRLRVKHSEGFWVLDVPRDSPDAEQQLKAEMQSYACKVRFDLEAKRFRGAMDGKTDLQRWVAWLTLYARARLKRGLGVVDEDRLSRLLFGHRARVCVTRTHVDVCFSLDELPIEIRLSGLDRDPGWVPAAGRFIAFHFE
jgi:hypothetical protein